MLPVLDAPGQETILHVWNEDPERFSEYGDHALPPRLAAAAVAAWLA
jgi:hypothetical protein